MSSNIRNIMLQNKNNENNLKIKERQKSNVQNLNKIKSFSIFGNKPEKNRKFINSNINFQTIAKETNSVDNKMKKSENQNYTKKKQDKIISKKDLIPKSQNDKETRASPIINKDDKKIIKLRTLKDANTDRNSNNKVRNAFSSIKSNTNTSTNTSSKNRVINKKFNTINININANNNNTVINNHLKENSNLNTITNGSSSNEIPRSSNKLYSKNKLNESQAKQNQNPFDFMNQPISPMKMEMEKFKEMKTKERKSDGQKIIKEKRIFSSSNKCLEQGNKTDINLSKNVENLYKNGYLEKYRNKLSSQKKKNFNLNKESKKIEINNINIYEINCINNENYNNLFTESTSENNKYKYKNKYEYLPSSNINENNNNNNNYLTMTTNKTNKKNNILFEYKNIDSENNNISTISSSLRNNFKDEYLKDKITKKRRKMSVGKKIFLKYKDKENNENQKYQKINKKGTKSQKIKDKILNQNIGIKTMKIDVCKLSNKTKNENDTECNKEIKNFNNINNTKDKTNNKDKERKNNNEINNNTHNDNKINNKNNEMKEKGNNETIYDINNNKTGNGINENNPKMINNKINNEIYKNKEMNKSNIKINNLNKINQNDFKKCRTIIEIKRNSVNENNKISNEIHNNKNHKSINGSIKNYINIINENNDINKNNEIIEKAKSTNSNDDEMNKNKNKIHHIKSQKIKNINKFNSMEPIISNNDSFLNNTYDNKKNMLKNNSHENSNNNIKNMPTSDESSNNIDRNYNRDVFKLKNINLIIKQYLINKNNKGKINKNNNSIQLNLASRNLITTFINEKFIRIFEILNKNRLTDIKTCFKLWKIASKKKKENTIKNTLNNIPKGKRDKKNDNIENINKHVMNNNYSQDLLNLNGKAITAETSKCFDNKNIFRSKTIELNEKKNIEEKNKNRNYDLVNANHNKISKEKTKRKEPKNSNRNNKNNKKGNLTDSQLVLKRLNDIKKNEMKIKDGLKLINNYYNKVLIKRKKNSFNKIKEKRDINKKMKSIKIFTQFLYKKLIKYTLPKMKLFIDNKKKITSVTKLIEFFRRNNALKVNNSFAKIRKYVNGIKKIDSTKKLYNYLNKKIKFKKLNSFNKLKTTINIYKKIKSFGILVNFINKKRFANKRNSLDIFKEYINSLKKKEALGKLYNYIFKTANHYKKNGFILFKENINRIKISKGIKKLNIFIKKINNNHKKISIIKLKQFSNSKKVLQSLEILNYVLTNKIIVIKIHCLNIIIKYIVNKKKEFYLNEIEIIILQRRFIQAKDAFNLIRQKVNYLKIIDAIERVNSIYLNKKYHQSFDIFNILKTHYSKIKIINGIELFERIIYRIILTTERNVMKLIKNLVKSRKKEINRAKNKKKKADNKKINSSSKNSSNHINKNKESPALIKNTNRIYNNKESKTSNIKNNNSNPFTITNLSKTKKVNRWSNNKIESTTNNIQIKSVNNNNNAISSSAMNYISFTLINSQRENRLSILDIIPDDNEKIWTISAEKWEVDQTDNDSFYQSKSNDDSINEDEDENENEYNIYKNNEPLKISRESQLIYNENNENEKWTQKEEQWIVDNNDDRLESFYERRNIMK